MAGYSVEERPNSLGYRLFFNYRKEFSKHPPELPLKRCVRDKVRKGRRVEICPCKKESAEALSQQKRRTALKGDEFQYIEILKLEKSDNRVDNAVQRKRR